MIKPVWWHTTCPTNCDIKFAVCLDAIRHERLTFSQFHWLAHHVVFRTTFKDFPNEYRYLLTGKMIDD